MNPFLYFKPSQKFFPTLLIALALLLPFFASGQTQSVSVVVTDNGSGPAISPDFVGLSYESSMLLPKNEKYYFDPNNTALINTFQTLGIKSLRVGANAVDDPRVPVPGEADIDSLFAFAHAAGVKVIYSFRLKNGSPAISGRLAHYIETQYADDLDSFSIGNEPYYYLKTFPAFFAAWKPHYDAILDAVPNARIDGPSVATANDWAVDLADTIAGEGHLAIASDHYYFLGSGRAAEKNPAAARARFLQDGLHADYQKDYAKVGAVLAAKGVPYRIDEMNSCYNGGAKDASDTYASTLWALDCTHWWAAHHIVGVNYHTGEAVGRDGGFGAANYAAFVHEPDGNGFAMRPQAYALLAFTQSARGRSLGINMQTAPDFNFDAYAYRGSDGSYYVTLINKSYADGAKTATVSIQLPPGTEQGVWRRMDLVQKNADVSAKTDVMLGGSEIDPQGIWRGKWGKVRHAKSGSLTVPVAPASAAILHFIPAS